MISGNGGVHPLPHLRRRRHDRDGPVGRNRDVGVELAGCLRERLLPRRQGRSKHESERQAGAAGEYLAAAQTLRDGLMMSLAGHDQASFAARSIARTMRG